MYLVQTGAVRVARGADAASLVATACHDPLACRGRDRLGGAADRADPRLQAASAHWHRGPTLAWLTAGRARPYRPEQTALLDADCWRPRDPTGRHQTSSPRLSPYRWGDGPARWRQAVPCRSGSGPFSCRGLSRGRGSSVAWGQHSDCAAYACGCQGCDEI